MTAAARTTRASRSRGTSVWRAEKVAKGLSYANMVAPLTKEKSGWPTTVL
jgi:hypothetical protein